MKYKGISVQELSDRNPIIHTVTTLFNEGSVETYQDALELMVLALAEANDNLISQIIECQQNKLTKIIIDKPILSESQFRQLYEGNFEKVDNE